MHIYKCEYAHVKKSQAWIICQYDLFFDTSNILRSVSFFDFSNLGFEKKADLPFFKTFSREAYISLLCWGPRECARPPKPTKSIASKGAGAHPPHMHTKPEPHMSVAGRNANDAACVSSMRYFTVPCRLEITTWRASKLKQRPNSALHVVF